MDEIKALKSQILTLSPLFNNQLATLELLEVEASPPFEETLPERDYHGFTRNKGAENTKLELSI